MSAQPLRESLNATLSTAPSSKVARLQLSEEEAWTEHLVQACPWELGYHQTRKNNININFPGRIPSGRTPGKEPFSRTQKVYACTLSLGMTAVWPTLTGLCKFGGGFGDRWSICWGAGGSLCTPRHLRDIRPKLRTDICQVFLKPLSPWPPNRQSQ